jgi:isopentenyl-diphosphate delta-isomerase
VSDPTSSSRKQDHIELAFKSQSSAAENDGRFYYEPVTGHHLAETDLKTSFLGKTLGMPLWISSMTGGTDLAGTINRRLAEACAEFGLGMGLGSCRRLLDDNTWFEDFNLRPVIGKELPFFANLGIAQVESLLAAGKTDSIHALVAHLQADGLIIHINPLQEWFQPEGDRFARPPLETIQEFIESADYQVIVKEVGQGMGPASIKALLQLPIDALDFGAFGGTNFSKLELLRNSSDDASLYADLAYIGHTAAEMTGFVEQAVAELGNKVQCRQVIVSGGIRNFLDGYWCMEKLPLNSIYAQGSVFLKYAQQDKVALKNYIVSQREGLILCKQFLKVR